MEVGFSVEGRKRKMMEQVTITLSPAALQRVQILAQRTGRPVPELLAETIELSFQPLGNLGDSRPVAEWSDAEILKAADAELPADADQQLSELLHRQQAGILTAEERTRLSSLMELYQSGLLHKAQALREAVRRGLREPLQP